MAAATGMMAQLPEEYAGTLVHPSTAGGGTSSILPQEDFCAFV